MCSSVIHFSQTSPFIHLEWSLGHFNRFLPVARVRWKFVPQYNYSRAESSILYVYDHVHHLEMEVQKGTIAVISNSKNGSGMPTQDLGKNAFSDAPYALQKGKILAGCQKFFMERFHHPSVWSTPVL